MNCIEIKYQISKDIFILFCALNALGYDDENNGKGMHPVRKKIRKALLKQDWPYKYLKLRKIIKNYHQSQLLIEISRNPLRSLRKGDILKKNFLIARNFYLELKHFSNESLIKKLWPEFRKIQLKETKKLFPIFKKEALNLAKFLNKQPTGIKKIILISNLLDAYWRGYGFKINGIGYVVVGPGADKNNGELIRHELLHVLAPNFNLPPEITKKTRSLASMGYGDRKIINQEYIIRGLNLLYKSKYCKKNITKMLKNEQKYFSKIKNAIEIIERKLKMAAN